MGLIVFSKIFIWMICYDMQLAQSIKLLQCFDDWNTLDHMLNHMEILFNSFLFIYLFTARKPFQISFTEWNRKLLTFLLSKTNIH